MIIMASGTKDDSADAEPESRRTHYHARAIPAPCPIGGQGSRRKPVPVHAGAARGRAVSATRRIAGTLSLASSRDAVDPPPDAIGRTVD